jgi:hypothetical protein
MNKQSAQEELLAYQGPVDSVAALLALPGFFEAVRQLSRGMMARIMRISGGFVHADSRAVFCAYFEKPVTPCLTGRKHER